MGPVLDYDFGYHGTSDVHVASILREGFRPTLGDGHWLGVGRRNALGAVYLFEDPSTAQAWAEVTAVPKHGGSPAVLQVMYTKDRRLDLTRLNTRLELRRFGQGLIDRLAPDALGRLKQTAGIRGLDDFVIREYLEALSTGGTEYRSIRAICAAHGAQMPERIFPPAGPLFERDGKRSWFDLHDHIQVAVLDPTAILHVSVFDYRFSLAWD
jgi:hypothetical protein